MALLELVGMLLCATTSGAVTAAYSLGELEKILDRAVTVSKGFIQDTVCNTDFKDTLNFLEEIGARYAGRGGFVWGREGSLKYRIKEFQDNVAKAHLRMPHLIVEAAVFEVVSSEVNKIEIPSEVFKAFDVPEMERTFDQSKMRFNEDGKRHKWDSKFNNKEIKDRYVPDITKDETKMWLFYAATRWIDAGAQAIHFGQLHLMADKDTDRKHTREVLTAVRLYAKQQKNIFVLLNAHAFQKRWRYELKYTDKNTDKLVSHDPPKYEMLLDFHAYPSRPRDIVRTRNFLDPLINKANEAQLVVDPPNKRTCGDAACEGIPLQDRKCSGSPYRASAGGGITPSGYYVDSLPYLVELDNFLNGVSVGQHVPCWSQKADRTWGTDEMIWFGSQPKSYRQKWLSDAVEWLKNEDPRGHFQMPGIRKMRDGVRQCYVAFKSEKSDRFYQSDKFHWDDTNAIIQAWPPEKGNRNSLRYSSESEGDSSESLEMGQVLTSRNGRWSFGVEVARKVKLVLRNLDESCGKNCAQMTVEEFNLTDCPSGGTLKMKRDGNLELTCSAQSVWQSKSKAISDKNDSGTAYLLLHDDGRANIYALNNDLIASWDITGRKI